MKLSSKLLLSFGLLFASSVTFSAAREICSDSEYADRLVENKNAWIAGSKKAKRQMFEAFLDQECSAEFDNMIANLRGDSDAHRSAKKAYVFMGYAVKASIIMAIATIIGASYLAYKKYVKKTESNFEENAATELVEQEPKAV